MYPERHPAPTPWLTRDIRPQAGDVVIRCLDGPPLTYAVGVVPGPPQVSFHDYDEALTRAREFGADGGVDVWVMEKGQAPTLVARQRRAEQPRGRQA